MKKYSLQDFKDKKKNKKMIKLTAIVLIALFIMILISLYIAHRGFRSFIDTYIFKIEISEDNANSITIDTDNLSLIHAYDKSLVIYNEGSINFYNSDAKKIGNIDITLSKPVADSSEKYLAIGDTSSQKVCLIKSNVLVWQKDLEGRISKITVNKNGYVGVSVAGTTHESIVMMFNPNGELLFSDYLSNYVVDLDISEDGKFVAIAQIDNSNILPSTKIEIISINLATTDANSATVNTYQTQSNEYLTGINFQKKGKLYCNFDKYVLVMTESSNERIYEISDLTAFSEVETENGFIRIDKEKSSVFKSDYRLKITHQSNAEKVYIIEGSLKALVSRDNKIALNLGREALFIKNNGWLKKRFIGNQEIKDIMVCEDLGIIIFRDKIVVIKL